jgi:hypothetical protein
MSMSAAACATSRTATYRRRQPERTVLYQTAQTHLSTWLELTQDESGRSTPAHVERESRRYLECGILAHDAPPRLPTVTSSVHWPTVGMPTVTMIENLLFRCGLA